MRSLKTRRKSAFVPRVVFQAVTVAGVIPLCAAAACGGSVVPITGEGGSDVIVPTVACVGFNGGPCGVAMVGFEGGTDAIVPTVACVGFEGGPCGVAVIGFDGGDTRLGVADIGFDSLPGVAVIGFDGSD